MKKTHHGDALQKILDNFNIGYLNFVVFKIRVTSAKLVRIIQIRTDAKNPLTQIFFVSSVSSVVHFP
jgi:hypothetical protein